MSSTSKSHVKFRKDSPTGGSRPSQGHRRSDSGVGSLSDDHDSRATNPDRSFTPADYDEQRYNVSALQEALASARESRDRWKAKAQELDADLTTTRKELKEVEARWKGLVILNEVVDGDKKKLFSEKKLLAEENAALREALEKAEKRLKRHSDARDPPVMRGAMPDESSRDKTKVRRSPSKSKRDKAAEAAAAAEQAKKDKARLSQRFARSSDDGETNLQSDTTPPKTHRSRRASYVEPMGPLAARPAAPMPPSPTRHYTTYTTSPPYQTQYTTMNLEPTMSTLPRSSHASYPYEESPFVEDGNYYPRPPPRSRETRGR